MNRREWIKHMALIAAGAAATPLQISAFERLYDTNTRLLGDIGLIEISEFSFGFGGLPCDASLLVRLTSDRGVLFSTMINKRATFRWVGLPGSPLLTTSDKLRWNVEDKYGDNGDNGDDLFGSIRFIGQDGLVKTSEFSGPGKCITDM